MILPIVKYGDPVLTQPGNPVGTITPETTRFVEDLIDTMRSKNGMGLAAPQVGTSKNIFVVDVSGVVKNNGSWVKMGGLAVPWEKLMPMEFLDPVVRPLNGQLSMLLEGCLSLPDVQIEVIRPSAIEVMYRRLDGLTVNMQCGGWLARAILHEYDHLKGTLIIDTIPAATRKTVLDKYFAMHPPQTP